MDEARITARVDVMGLDAAINKFGTLTNNVNDVQRAMRQIYGIAQGAERVPGGGAVVTPHQMEQMQRHLDTLRRGEAEITKQVSDRKTKIDEIVGKSKEMQNQFKIFEKLGFSGAEQQQFLRGVNPSFLGMTKEDHATLLANMKDMPGLESRLAKTRDALPQAEMLGNAIGVKTADAQERVLERWLPKLGRTMAIGLGVLGVGSLLGILGHARSAARDFEITAVDLAGSLGLSPGDAARFRKAGLGTEGRFGIPPTEALRIQDLIAGGFGRGSISPEMIARFGGLGKEGYAKMASDMSMTSFLPGQSESDANLQSPARAKSGKTSR